MSTPNTQFRFFSDWPKDCIDTKTETKQSWIQKFGVGLALGIGIYKFGII